MTDNKQQLRTAVQAALDGNWEASHHIAQDYSDASANWLHAVLHKIEGDVENSHYWYAQTSNNNTESSGTKSNVTKSNSTEVRKYTDFSDVRDELMAILKSLN